MKKLLICTAAALWATGAQAVVITNDEVAFNAATSALSFELEDFETTSIAGVFSADLGAFTISNQTPMSTETDAINCVGGSNCINLGSSFGFEELVFANPVNAVSFFIGNDAVSRSFLFKVDGVTVNDVVQTGDAPGLEPTFFGIYDLANSFFSIEPVFSSDSWHIDNVSYSTAAVPLPATMPLIAGAICALMTFRRRRKKTV